MSIDVHEAIKAIKDMLPIIDPEDDYLTIVAAEENIAAAEARRKKEIEEAHANMRALAKVLEAARVSSTRPTSVPSAEAHAAALNELDASRLSLAKSISDVEGLVASREAELAALKEETRRLEEYDPALEHRKEMDSSVLRLRMYEKLGFEPLLDENGALVKMLVRSSQSTDTHVVILDKNKSEFEQCQELWKIASS